MSQPVRGVGVVVSWLPAALYVGVIWWLSSQQIKLPLAVPGSDKGVHFVEYGVLGACFAHAVTRTWPGRGLRGAIVAVWLTVGAGLIDELHQAFIPGRTAELLDLAADAVGALAFVVAFFLARRVWAAPPPAPPEQST